MRNLKKRYFFIFLLGILVWVVGFTTATRAKANKIDIHESFLVENPQLATVTAEIKGNETEHVVNPPMIGKSFVGFKEALAYRESRGNYFVVNPYGYMGKYQFGKSALKFYGIKDADEFLNSPELQEKLFIVSLQRNKWVLRNEINQHVGKRINGIQITKSGILAAAHLAGVESVKQFFRYQGNFFFADANGTTLQSYMKNFGGYNLDFIEPDEKPSF